MWSNTSKIRLACHTLEGLVTFWILIRCNGQTERNDVKSIFGIDLGIRVDWRKDTRVSFQNRTIINHKVLFDVILVFHFDKKWFDWNIFERNFWWSEGLVKLIHALMANIIAFFLIVIIPCSWPWQLLKAQIITENSNKWSSRNSRKTITTKKVDVV